MAHLSSTRSPLTPAMIERSGKSAAPLAFRLDDLFIAFATQIRVQRLKIRSVILCPMQDACSDLHSMARLRAPQESHSTFKTCDRI
jgi:hypothetical protein